METVDRGAERRARLLAARLYLVCPSIAEEGAEDARELPDLLRAASAGGVDIVQLRDKHVPDEVVIAVAKAARALCERLGTLLIVNDRPLVEAEVGADGVHVGQEDMPPGEVRRLVGPDLLIGLSTHTPEQIDAVDPALVDYIGVGPVHATPTKPGRAPVGLELVRYAAGHSPLPFFAIGGIDTTNVGAVGTAGARRIAVVRALTESHDPEMTAAKLRGAVAGEPDRTEAEVGAA